MSPRQSTFSKDKAKAQRSATPSKADAKQKKERKLWCESDYCLLLKLSFLGQSRSELQVALNRSAGKVFSKI